MSIRPLFEYTRTGTRSTVGTSKPVSRAKAEVIWRQRVYLWGAVFVAACFAAIFATRASGQTYDSVQMKPEKLRNDTKLQKQCINATKTYASTGEGNTRYVQAYLTSYVPAKMTGPDGLKQISRQIADVEGILARAGRSGNRQNELRLMGMVFNTMKGVAKGNYYPAARISAISLLSRLNSTPPNFETRKPPVPLKQVLPILIELYQDESNVDGVRAAALHGIHRHVNMARLSDDQKAQIAASMEQLLAADAPEGRSELAHAYLQRFAVDILAKLGGDSQANLGETLLAISSDKSAPDLIAFYAAGTLGGLGEGIQGKVEDPAPVLDSWMRRTFKAFEGELDRLNARTRPEKVPDQPKNPQDFLKKVEEEEKLANNGGFVDSGPGGGMGMGGMSISMGGGMGFGDGGGMGMGMGGMSISMGGAMMEEEEEEPQPPEVIASRQKLNMVMQYVHLGATGHPAASGASPGGLMQAVPDNQRAAINNWIRSMEPVLESLNESKFEDLDTYMAALENQVAVLRELAGDEPEAELESTEDAEEADVAGRPANDSTVDDLVGP